MRVPSHDQREFLFKRTIEYHFTVGNSYSLEEITEKFNNVIIESNTNLPKVKVTEPTKIIKLYYKVKKIRTNHNTNTPSAVTYLIEHDNPQQFTYIPRE